MTRRKERIPDYIRVSLLIALRSEQKRWISVPARRPYIRHRHSTCAVLARKPYSDEFRFSHAYSAVDDGKTTALPLVNIVNQLKLFYLFQ